MKSSPTGSATNVGVPVSLPDTNASATSNDVTEGVPETVYVPSLDVELAIVTESPATRTEKSKSVADVMKSGSAAPSYTNSSVLVSLPETSASTTSTVVVVGVPETVNIPLLVTAPVIVIVSPATRTEKSRSAADVILSVVAARLARTDIVSPRSSGVTASVTCT